VRTGEPTTRKPAAVIAGRGRRRHGERASEDGGNRQYSQFSVHRSILPADRCWHRNVRAEAAFRSLQSLDEG
jgi:hypothetical protein